MATAMRDSSSPQARDLTDDARSLWTASLDALAIVDESRRYLCVNGEAVALLGGPAQRLLRRRIEDFTPKEHWPRLMRMWSELRRMGRLRGEYEVLHDDGSRFEIDFSAVYGFRPGEHLIIARHRAPERAPAAAAEAPRLTRREREILQFAAEGRPARAIASTLFLSESTVKTHFERAYQKLGARDRVSAVANAMRLGIIS